MLFNVVVWHTVVFGCRVSFDSTIEQDVAKQLRDQQMVMKGHRDDALVHVRVLAF